MHHIVLSWKLVNERPSYGWVGCLKVLIYLFFFKKNLSESIKIKLVCPFASTEPALHAPDQLLSQQTQWELWARWNGGQGQQEVHQLVHRVPPQQRLRRGKVLGGHLCTLVVLTTIKDTQTQMHAAMMWRKVHHKSKKRTFTVKFLSRHAICTELSCYDNNSRGLRALFHFSGTRLKTLFPGWWFVGALYLVHPFQRRLNRKCFYPVLIKSLILFLLILYTRSCRSVTLVCPLPFTPSWFSQHFYF